MFYRKKEENFDNNNNNIDNINKKKILCKSVLEGIKCQYGDNCVYAHSLKEQKMDKERKHAYDVIKNQFDLSTLDTTQEELYKNLSILTKICNECINKKCPGGVNCKFGVYNKSLQLCNEDMMSGQCKTENCSKIHLTERGFIPINKNKIKKKKNTNIIIPKPFELSEEFFLSDNYKNLLTESNINIDDISSVDSSLDETIFD